MDIKYVEQHTIFETIVGSQAYGLSTPESDVDKAGVMIPGKEYFFGTQRFGQYNDYPEEDKVVYDIRKILGLLADNNPNCLDLLYVPDRCILYTSKWWDCIREKRDLFLSKKARFTFAAYAKGQIERIETHRKYLLNPPQKQPQRSEFGLDPVSVFPTAQIKSILYSVMGDFFKSETKEEFLNELDAIYGDYLMPLFYRHIKSDRSTLAMDWLQISLKSQCNTLCQLGDVYIKGEYIEQAEKELKFYHAQKDWERYKEWEKSRNKKRAELEKKFGFDCYSDDTEFLTSEGWKKFDDITDKDKLATVFCGDFSHRKHFSMEYQEYTDKFDSIFTGNMYNLYGNHLDVLVTPNHRMLYRKKERASQKVDSFVLEEISRLPDTFEILIAPTPITKTYENKELKDIPIKPSMYLKLMGWYLSDGCMNMQKNKRMEDSPQAIRISQKENGKIHWLMSRFKHDLFGKIACNIYSYKRTPNKFCPYEITEVVLIISDKDLKTRLLQDCGRLKEKRIPRYVFNLSKCLKEILFNALIGGDGTVRNTSFKSLIYYSSIKNLANDVQELALSCGWETSLYGPYKEKNDGYEIDMYQVHINKNKDQLKTCIRAHNIKKVPVTNQRIVCFTVPNGTLITRRNGHIGINGNCKHASHAIRLTRMCQEILEKGEVNVDRTGIDAEELRAIKNGAWSFDMVKEYAVAMEDKLIELYNSSTLQKAADRGAIDQLCIDTCEEYLRSKVER